MVNERFHQVPGKYTLGIEEEFQPVDATTGRLKSAASLINLAQEKLGEQVKGEFLQCSVETATGICPDIVVGRAEAFHLRAVLSELAASQGLRLVAAGTHPGDFWREQVRTDNPRYAEIEEQLQDVIRAALIYGLHIHIGIEDRERQIMIMNQARIYLPHVLALSANSPIFQGRNTGYKSFRTVIWATIPHGGLPDLYPSYGEFERYVNTLVATNCIDNGRKIWWDVRPHPVYSTLEFRICDMPATPDETIAIAALFQALVAKLDWMVSHNRGLLLCSTAMLNENKWRAARYGLDGKLIDYSNMREVPTRDALHELLDFVDDVVDDLGSRQEMDFLGRLADNHEGTGADYQLSVYKQTGDVISVVRWLAAATMRGIASHHASTEKPGSYRAGESGLSTI